MKHLLFSMAFPLLFLCSLQAKTIPLNHPNIQVMGANYVYPSVEKLHYCRFSEVTLNAPLQNKMFNPENAKTNSGIKIRFKTASPFVNLTFMPQAGSNRGSEFAVLQNGELAGKFDFKGEASKKEMILKIINIYTEQETLFEVVLPSLSNVALTKLEIDDLQELGACTPERRPIYLALGNSITHGVGQGSASYLTYPYLLAENLGFDYYNLAVGGAKISQAIATQTAEMPQADIITILIGYNDLHFNNKTVAEYTSSYQAYLSEIRKNQPNARIFCISLTHTRSTGNEKTRVTPDDYRKALKTIVETFQSNGDDKLVFVAGDKITSEANLNLDNPEDRTHMSIKGAAMFADELNKIINQWQIVPNHSSI